MPSWVTVEGVGHSGGSTGASRARRNPQSKVQARKARQADWLQAQLAQGPPSAGHPKWKDHDVISKDAEDALDAKLIAQSPRHPEHFQICSPPAPDHGQGFSASPSSGEQEENDEDAPFGKAPRPAMLGALKARRRAWADMVSDESGSEPDFMLGPASPSSGSACTSPSRTEFQPSTPLGKDGKFHEAPGRSDSEAKAQTEDSEEVSAAQWAAEVMAMAERLRDLAGKAPGRARCQRFSVSTETEVSVGDIGRWAAAAEQLQALQTELQQVQAELAQSESEAVEAERRCSAARAMVAAQAAKAAELAAASVLKDQAFAAEVAAAESSLQVANDSAAAAARLAKKNADSSEASVRSLRERLAAELAAAAEAEAEVQRALAAREARRELPELRKRRKAGEAAAARAEAACGAGRASVAQLRAELAAAKESADARAVPLETRRAQLEKECAEIQNLEAPAKASAAADEAAEAAKAVLAEELKSAQASNRELLVMVREARAEKEFSSSEVENLQSEVRDLKAAIAGAEMEGAVSEELREELLQKEAIAQEEVSRLQEQIRDAEQQVQDSEEAAKSDRARQAEVEASKRGLQLARRRAEEVATVLEWRLQKAAVQLEKEQPGNSWVKCLLNAGGGQRTSTLASLGLQQATRSKRFARLSSTGQGGSEADESTTAASETLCEP